MEEKYRSCRKQLMKRNIIDSIHTKEINSIESDFSTVLHSTQDDFKDKTQKDHQEVCFISKLVY